MFKKIQSNLHYFALGLFILFQLSLNTRVIDTFSVWHSGRNNAETLNDLSIFVNGFGLGIAVWVHLIPKLMDYLKNAKWCKNYHKYIKTWFVVPLMFYLMITVYSLIQGLVLTVLVSSSTADMRKMSILAQAQTRVDDTKLGFDRAWMNESSFKAALTMTPYLYATSFSPSDIRDGGLVADAAAYQLMPSLRETCEKVVPLINAYSSFFSKSYSPYSANMIGDIALTQPSQRAAAYKASLAKYVEDFKNETGMSKAPPPGLGWDAFTRHPVIVEHMRETIKNKGAPSYIYDGFKPYMTCLEFQDKIFKPEHNKEAKHLNDTMMQSSADFDVGGKYYDYSVRSIRKTYIPMVIFISTSLITLPIFLLMIAIPLAHAALNKFGHSFYLDNKQFINKGVVTFMVIILFVIPMAGGVSSSGKMTFASGLFTRWQIGVEPLFYRGFGLFGERGRFSCMSDHFIEYRKDIFDQNSGARQGPVQSLSERWSTCLY